MIVLKPGKLDASKGGTLWDGLKFKCDKCGAQIQLEASDQCSIISDKTGEINPQYDIIAGSPKCPTKRCGEVTILKFKDGKLKWTSSQGER